MLARAAGRSPLAAVHDIAGGGAPSAAAAEANMAALLEELELEEEGCVPLPISGHCTSAFPRGFSPALVGHCCESLALDQAVTLGRRSPTLPSSATSR